MFRHALLILSLTLGACHTKRFGPEEHKQEPDRGLTGAQDDRVVAREILYPNLKTPVEYEKIVNSKPSAEALAAEVVQPLAAFILKTETLRNSLILADHDNFNWYVRIFHQGLLDLKSKNERSPQLLVVLAEYEKSLLAPCFRDSHQCQRMREVQERDSRFTQVVADLVALIDLPTDKKWKYSFYALDFSKAPLTGEFQKRFYANLEAYLKTIEMNGSRESLLKLKDASEKLNQMANLNPGVNPQLRDFLDRIQIWRTDGLDSTDGAIGPGKREALRKAIWPSLIQHSAINNGRPDPEFAKWVSQELQSLGLSSKWADPVLRGPFLDIWSPFRDGGPFDRVKVSLQLRDPRETDPIVTFILDKLFKQELGRPEATTLLAQLNPSLASFAAVTNQYVRLSFAFMMMQTHRDLKDRVASNGHYSTPEDLEESLIKAQPWETRWMEFSQRVTIIQDIATNYAETHQRELAPGIRKLLDDTFHNFNQHVKWFVTYPNMLPVMHFISEANLRKKIQILWFTLDINSDTIFREFFLGNFTAWFKFTSVVKDDESFRSPEILMAFRNAVISDLFQSYGMTPSTFLLTAVDRLMTTTSTILDGANEALYNAMFVAARSSILGTEGEPGVFKAAYDFCKGKDVPETLLLKELYIQVAPYQETLISSFTKDRNGAIYSAKVPTGNSYEGNASNLVDTLRTDHIYLLRMLKQMVAFYEGYLNQFNLKDDQMPLIHQKLDEVDNRLRKYFGLLFYGINRYDQTLYCMEDIAEKRKMALIDYEYKAYLRPVFDKAQEVLENPSRLNAINNSLVKVYPELGVQNRDRMTIKGPNLTFYYNKGDFLMRVRQHLMFGVTEMNLPAIAPKLKVVIPENGQSDQRFLAFFFSQTAELPVTITKEDTFEKFTERASYALINQTRNILNSQSVQNFIDWDSSHFRSLALQLNQFRIGMEVNLMKMGDMEIYDYEKPDCQAAQSGDDFEFLNKNCKATESFTPDELYKRQIRVLNHITLNDERRAYLKKIRSPSYSGDKFAWTNVFFSDTDKKPLGVLDVYLFAASQDVLGDSLKFPDDKFSETTVTRRGQLKWAKSYFEAFGTQGASMLPVLDKLEGGIKDLYKSFAQQEFGLHLALEKRVLIAEMRGEGPYLLDLVVDETPDTIPNRTNYTADAQSRLMNFMKETDFIFEPITAPAQ